MRNGTNLPPFIRVCGGLNPKSLCVEFVLLILFCMRYTINCSPSEILSTHQSSQTQS